MSDNGESHGDSSPQDDGAVEEGEHLEERVTESERLRRDVERNAYRLLTTAAVLILAVGTIVFRVLEDWSWVDSFYFSSIAVTTVGFGDLTPTTDATKLFTVIYVFSGIAIIASFLNVRLKRHGRAIARRGSSTTSSGPSTRDST